MHVPISLSVCFVLAATVVAQKPHPCKSPPLMVGRLSLIYPKGEMFVYERFTYDALGKRIRLRAQGVEHNHSFYEDLLMLFREGVVYQISYKNQTCTKKPMDMPFQPIEIPQDATLQSQIILGSSSGPGQGLLVNNWMGEIPEQKAKFYTTFTEFGCLPLSSLYTTDETGWILSSFFDILIGIDDPQDFIPPDFCDTTKPVDNELVVTDFFEALKNN
ncbi:hypothetical protein COCON_G00081030 [Conger conger]|uniref:Ependymin n=1 Tax=Conger conger TaxID=82655 RepID=A0A9Q1I1Y0_CONCO|nr:ependymin-like [Conger conger]KAJ8276351.1 hypothetical protein COCON_G00081030 [Conger conger]